MVLARFSSPYGITWPNQGSWFHSEKTPITYRSMRISATCHPLLLVLFDIPTLWLWCKGWLWPHYCPIKRFLQHHRHLPTCDKKNPIDLPPLHPAWPNSVGDISINSPTASDYTHTGLLRLYDCLCKETSLLQKSCNWQFSCNARASREPNKKVRSWLRSTVSFEPDRWSTSPKCALGT